MSVHTHILPDQAIKPFTNHSTLPLSSKSTTLRMLPRHLWRSWNGRRYLWGKLHQNSDPVSQVCVDLPLLNMTYLSTQVHRKAHSIRWLRILWALEQIKRGNLRTMNSCARMELLRICAVQLQLPGSKSETQNRQKLPQDPQIPFPGSKSFAAPKQSSHQF